MKASRLILIGILFAGTIFILVWGLNFLKGKNFLQPEKEYYAAYERIGGLMISSPVTLKGFKVGDVREIFFDDRGYDRVMVRFAVTYPDLELPDGTEARIYSTDLMGTKGVQLILGDGTGTIAYGDTLTGSIEGDLKDQVNTQMLPLKRKAEDLMASMDSVLVALQLVFDQQNRSNLAQSFEIVTQTLQNFEHTSVFLDTFVKAESSKFSYIMNNLDSLSDNLVSRTQELQNTLINLGEFTDTLNEIPIGQTVSQFSQVLAEIDLLIQGINAGEGSLGKLIVNDSLYYQIETISYSLNNLLDDIRKNPKRYVRLSAVDRGKTIVISDEQDMLTALADERDLSYFACLARNDSEWPVDHPHRQRFKKIKHIQVGTDHFYYLEETSRYDKARRIVERHVAEFPDAGVYTWLKGKWTQLSF